MKRRTWMIGGCLAGIFAVMTMDSCKHGQCDTGEASVHGSSRSHNQGKNCQHCHRPDGEVCWLVGGTAYDSLTGNTSANVTVRLYTQPNDSGELRLTLEGDAIGNFYTSEDPDLSAGLYPTITTANGHTSRMEERITTGACNSCHGVTTEKIRVH